MKEIVNLEKLNSYGLKQPANNPNYVTPDNITHAQLRYNDFTSSYVIQGSAVGGANSTFEFDVLRQDLLLSGKTHSRMKLYTSTDGTNYTENKTYGGSLGKSLYEEGLFICNVNFTNPIAGSLSVILNTVYYNNAHVTVTRVRADVGLYYLQFSQNVIGASQDNVITSRGTIIQDSGAILGYCINDTSLATVSRIYFYTMGSDGFTPTDDIATNHLLEIKILMG